MHIHILTKYAYNFSGLRDLGKSVKSRLGIPVLKCLEVWKENPFTKIFFSL